MVIKSTLLPNTGLYQQKVRQVVLRSDDQESLASRYGWGVAEGRSVKDIETWPQAIANVTLDDVKRAADTYLDLCDSVTGYLVPEEPEGAGKRIEQPVAHSATCRNWPATHRWPRCSATFKATRQRSAALSISDTIPWAGHVPVH